MTPLGDRLLVRPREEESTTAGGILLAGSSGSKPGADALIGKVVALGPEVDCGVAVGDTVLFSKYSSRWEGFLWGEGCRVPACALGRT